MLAEKLLDKVDYGIDTDIRTLELLKIYFDERSMQNVRSYQIYLQISGCLYS
ncbi:hypothetical protein Hanom_Chr13g01229251 [Helianthus anomalus]